MTDKQPPNLSSGAMDKLPPASILHPSNPNNSQSMNNNNNPFDFASSEPALVPQVYVAPAMNSYGPQPSSITTVDLQQHQYQPQYNQQNQHQPHPQQYQPQPPQHFQPQFAHPSVPAAVPLPPPGSLAAAPGYNLDLDDEWCMVDNSKGQPIPPNHMPTSISVHSSQPAPNGPVGATQGSENLGYVYPTINQAVLHSDPRASHIQSATPFVVNPPPGAQVFQPPSSVSSSQPFYPYGQQPTEALVTYSPFNITADVANNVFIKWKEHLWFTPADFGSKMCEAQLKPILMPYYIFDASVYTSYEGQVGFVETTVSYNNHVHSSRSGTANHASTATNTTIRWRKATGSKSGMYPGVLSVGSVVKEDHPKLLQIDGWRVDSLITTPMSTDQLGPAVDWSSAFYSTPNGAFSMITTSEEQACSDHLKRDNHADRTSHVHVSVGITSLSYRVVYLPIYFTVYSYQSRVFKVFINGQTGKIYGERPYGVGGLVNGLKTIGSLFMKKPKVEVLSGVELQSRDNTTVYNPSSYFLVLPPSDRQLRVESVGFVTVTNDGSSPVQLVSQKRLTQVQGGAALLQPHSTKSFDFIGSWVIELVGEHSQIRVVEVATKGGAKGNELNMKA